MGQATGSGGDETGCRTGFDGDETTDSDGDETGNTNTSHRI